MKLTAIVDWYVLERLRGELLFHPPSEDDIRGRVIASQIEYAFSDLTDKLSLALRDYLFMICFGEARHAWDKAEGRVPSNLPQTSYRSRAFEMALQFAPNEHNINLIYDVFEDNDWASAFGGGAWAKITKAIKLYSKHKAIFIDHVVDLHHNGGDLFDKDDAYGELDFSTDWFFNDGSLKLFLNVKYEHDLLDCESDYLGYLSWKTRRLVWEFFGHFKHGVAKLARPADLNMFGVEVPEWYDYEPVAWGDEQLDDDLEYVNVTVCDRCGEMVNSRDSFSLDWNTYCESCYDKYFSDCDKCGHTVDNDDLNEIEGSGVWVCSSCYADSTECKGCDMRFHEDDLTEYYHDHGEQFWVCSSCEDKISDCTECGTLVFDTDLCNDCEKVVRGYLPGQLVLPGLEVYVG